MLPQSNHHGKTQSLSERPPIRTNLSRFASTPSRRWFILPPANFGLSANVECLSNPTVESLATPLRIRTDGGSTILL
jgi:hypothetical protein